MSLTLDPRVRRWLPLAAALAVAVLAVVYYRVAWGGVLDLVAALDHCKELYCDLTHQYYPTGREILASGRPSNGYFYSSFFALLLAPFGAQEPPAAVALWSVVQLLSVGLLLLPAIDFYRESPVAGVLYVALLVFSMPLLHNLKWGQVSTLVTGCAFAALFLYRRGRWRWAAVVLAFAMAIKYYIAVVAFYWLLRRDWRFLVVLVIAFLLLWLVIPTAVLGPEGNRQFYVVVRERVAHAMTTWMPEDINAQYLPSVIGRWLGDGSGRGVWRVAGYGIFVANLLVVARLVLRRGLRAAEWSFALLFLSLPFAIDTSWPHYFVYLPFAQVLVWLAISSQYSVYSEQRLGAGRGPWSVVRRPWSVILIVLWAASVVLASMPFFQLIGRWQDYSQYGVLFVANLCLFVAAHTIVIADARRDVATPQAIQSGPPTPAA